MGCVMSKEVYPIVEPYPIEPLSITIERARQNIIKSKKNNSFR